MASKALKSARLEAAMQKALTAGNHLAVCLGSFAPAGWESWTPDDARAQLRGHRLELWYAWRGVMDARKEAYGY